MRIAVVGAGAIGCLFGGRLHRAGQTVLLIHHKRDVAASIEEKGVRIRELSGKVVRVRLHTRTGLSRLDKPDLVLVTVKAYDSEAVASLLEKSVMRNVPVLSLQNGLGNVEELTSRLGADSTIAGTTTEGAMTTGPGVVIHTGRGITWLGEMNGRLSDRCLTIQNAFRKAGFTTIISKNIKGVLWAKAIVNSAINPITAITRVRNGDVRDVRELREIASELVDEGITVAHANGILLKPSPKSLLAKVLALTSRNKSSMLQDIEAGRKTEIMQLNGSISRQGRLIGLSTPFNDLLTKLVLALERPHRNL
ncbi:MAG TPA: 2-dehydropantoate 2-reductase [Candidatus Angelobacter sp.]|nr:2-dehydropantoate 2-reductase [Candidatus Angelobacter sp.]